MPCHYNDCLNDFWIAVNVNTGIDLLHFERTICREEGQDEK